MVTSLEDLNRELKAQNLIGYWTFPNTSTGFGEPEPNYGPFPWKWQEIRAALDQAAHLIRPEEAFRRFIGYQHPQLKLGTPLPRSGSGRGSRIRHSRTSTSRELT